MSCARIDLKGRSVLVTGHTGFKGSWLCLALHRLGAVVHGLSLPPPTRPSHYELARIAELLRSETIGDVRNAETVQLAMQRSGPDIVLHLAAQPIVRRAYEDPVETFSTNILGTVQLLDAIRVRKQPCVAVIVTSDKVYERLDAPRGHTEADPMGGDDPYSASKGATELVVQSFRRSYFRPAELARHGVKLVSARAGNVIGGGDWARDRILVDGIKALSENRPVLVRNPRSLRPWQHVTDVIHAYLTLVAELCTNDDPALLSPWNFGPPPGLDLTVADLVTEMCDAWGEGTWLSAEDPNSPYENPALRLDAAKALSLLGIGTRFVPREAVRMAVRWYRAWADGHRDVRVLSEGDLDAHERAGQVRQSKFPPSAKLEEATSG